MQNTFFKVIAARNGVIIFRKRKRITRDLEKGRLLNLPKQEHRPILTEVIPHFSDEEVSQMFHAELENDFNHPIWKLTE